ncbi:IS3 family transposase [Domibacillus aminovorans]
MFKGKNAKVSVRKNFISKERFNKLRIHGTLGYVSPVDFKKMSLKKVV